MERLYRKERRPLVAAFLDDHPVCAKCCQARAVDVHELKSRARGGSITDRANLAALCRRCHEWITTHPAEAEGQGWLVRSWQ